jgi:Ulp1 family protease
MTIIDSLHHDNSSRLSMMKDWYKAICDSYNVDNPDNWTTEFVGMGSRPRQHDGYSCGVFVMITIAYILLCSKLPTNTNFGDSDLADIRLYIAYIIILNSGNILNAAEVRLIVQLNENSDNDNDIFN